MKSWNMLLSTAPLALPAMAQETQMADAAVKLPPCAVSCLGRALSRSQCSSTNHACLCADQTLQDTMTTCVMGTCTLEEALFTRNLTATSCSEPARDKSAQYVAVSNSFAIISAVFVAQRFAYKYWAKLSYGLDDWLTLLTAITSIPGTILNAYPMIKNGMGRDVWTLTLDNITNLAEYFYIMEIFYFAGICLMKLALLFFYIRVFQSNGVRRLLLGTVALVSLFGMAFVVLAVFQCSPINHYWLQFGGESQGRCISLNAMALSNAIASVAIDVWMLVIPLWQLRSLKLDLRKKIGVAMMFCVGSFVTIVSMLRFRPLLRASASTANPTTWDFFDIAIWSIVEVNVGIMCVCMPSLRLLLVRLFICLSGMAQRFGAENSSGERQSATVRNRSPPLGTGTTSHAERSQKCLKEANDMESICHTTYTVNYGGNYGDNDELHLGYIRELDEESAQSKPTSIS